MLGIISAIHVHIHMIGLINAIHVHIHMIDIINAIHVHIHMMGIINAIHARIDSHDQHYQRYSCTYYSGSQTPFFGKPDMACCKRLCDKIIIHGPSGVNWSCTTLNIFYWIGVVALITVPPSMTKRCYNKSQHNLQIYFISLFLIKYKTTWYIV